MPELLGAATARNNYQRRAGALQWAMWNVRRLRSQARAQAQARAPWRVNASTVRPLCANVASGAANERVAHVIGKPENGNDMWDVCFAYCCYNVSVFNKLFHSQGKPLRALEQQTLGFDCRSNTGEHFSFHVWQFAEKQISQLEESIFLGPNESV